MKNNNAKGFKDILKQNINKMVPANPLVSRKTGLQGLAKMVKKSKKLQDVIKLFDF